MRRASHSLVACSEGFRAYCGRWANICVQRGLRSTWIQTPCSRSKVLCGAHGKAGNSHLGDKLALKISSDQASARVEAVEVRHTAWCKACQFRPSEHCRRVVGYKPGSLGNRRTRELPQVRDGGTHRQH